MKNGVAYKNQNMYLKLIFTLTKQIQASVAIL